MCSCIAVKDLDFKGVEKFKVENLSNKEAKVRVSVKVDNPNNFNVKIKKADLDLMIGEKKVGKAKLDHVVIIPKKKESIQDIIISADDLNLRKTLASNFLSVLMSGKIKAGVKGKVKAGVFIINKKFDLDLSDHISVRDLDLFKKR